MASVVIGDSGSRKTGARRIFRIILVAGVTLLIAQTGLYLAIGTSSRISLLMTRCGMDGPFFAGSAVVDMKSLSNREQRAVEAFAAKNGSSGAAFGPKIISLHSPVGLPRGSIRASWDYKWRIPFAFRAHYQLFDVDYLPIEGEGTWVFVFGEWMCVWETTKK